MPDRPLSTLATRVKLRMDAMQINQRTVQRKCGFNHGFISDLLRGTKQNVNDDALDRIAQALETSIEFLRGHTDDPAAPIRSPTERRRPLVPRIPASARIAALISHASVTTEDAADVGGPADAGVGSSASDEDDEDFERQVSPPPPLPIGFALHRLSRTPLLTSAHDRRGRVFRAPLQLFEAGEDGNICIADGCASRTFTRPPSVYAMPDAYAVRWPNDRLTPRVRAGETIVVAPSLYPRIGHDVLVVERGTEGSPPVVTVAGRFAGANYEHVLLELYDSRTRIQLEFPEILAIHVIVAILVSH